MTGTSAAVQANCRRSAYRPYRTAGRKAKYGRFSALPRPEIHRNLRIKDSVKIKEKLVGFAMIHPYSNLGNVIMPQKSTVMV